MLLLLLLLLVVICATSHTVENTETDAILI